MSRLFQIAGLLWLAAVAGICDQNKVVKSPPPNKKDGLPRKNGGVMPKAGPRLANPASPAARLFKATPEERERVIEKLPPAQQARVRNQLQYFDSLPKDQQQIMIGRTERLDAMTPEKRRAFNQQMQNMNHLPPDRQQAVRGALRRLQVMPEARRIIILNSDQFKAMFSPEEQKMIADLSEVMLPPM